MSMNYNGEGQNMRFINPNTLQQQEGAHFDYTRQERRFSYASMLSDSDPYLSPSNNSDDFHQHDPPSMNSFIDPIYVDLHKQQYPSLMEQRQSYYDYSYYQHGYLCSSKEMARPMTPVSPPLLMKETYSQESHNKKKTPRSRGRRVSNVPGCGARMFTCKADGCGKVFKRSEHLKRHIRSIHTLEKPFECPYQSCNKRFSRSDNLNQHIRIHRNSQKETTTKPMQHIKLESINNNINHRFNHTNSANSTFSNFI